MFIYSKPKKLFNLLCHKSKFLYGATPYLSFVKHGTTWPEWQLPEGYDTGIKVYNTVAKAKVPLVTKLPGYITWYMCGPTVYDSPHIGHGLCYLRFDIIRRILRDYFNLNVLQVMGITDIDDKIINKATYFKVDINEISGYFEREFFKDLSLLGIQKPNLCTRVTDHVHDIISFIEVIEKAGLAYRTSDGSVFFNNIAYRTRRQLTLPDDTPHEDDDSHTTDAVHPNKRHPIDFALWKGAKKDEPSWPSVFGPGRPGWHIECSAMASSVFGESLDVHSGGVDLLFPHHYCEEAQSCARHSTNIWTNYWWHSGHLTIDSEKMSKSIGNVVSIKELLKRHSANTFRQFALTTHYTNDVIYRDNTLTVAASQVARIQEMLDSCYDFIQKRRQLLLNPDDETKRIATKSVELQQNHPLLLKLEKTKAAVEANLRDDFNTPAAMRSILSLVLLTNSYLNMQSPEAGSPYYEGTVGPGRPEGISYYEILLVRQYILKLMRTLGMNYADRESISRKSEVISSSVASSGGEGEDDTNAPPLSEVMKTLLSFRHTVRQEALNITKQQLAELSESEQHWRRQHKSTLLKSCDELRQALQRLSIVVKDQKDGASWKVTKDLKDVFKEKSEVAATKKEVTASSREKK